MASTEETKPNTTKANILADHKYTRTQNKRKKTETRFGRHLYDLRPGNGAGHILIVSGAHTKPMAGLSTIGGVHVPGATVSEGKCFGVFIWEHVSSSAFPGGIMPGGSTWPIVIVCSYW